MEGKQNGHSQPTPASGRELESVAAPTHPERGVAGGETGWSVFLVMFSIHSIFALEASRPSSHLSRKHPSFLYPRQVVLQPQLVSCGLGTINGDEFRMNTFHRSSWAVRSRH